MEAQQDYRKLVEAALFMSTNALSAGELAEMTGIASVGHVEKLVRELADDYRTRDTAIEVVEIDKRFMFSLKEPYA